MSFTALDGLPMGTRCGALDAGVLEEIDTYIAHAKETAPAAFA